MQLDIFKICRVRKLKKFNYLWLWKNKLKTHQKNGVCYPITLFVRFNLLNFDLSSPIIQYDSFKQDYIAVSNSTVKDSSSELRQLSRI